MECIIFFIITIIKLYVCIFISLLIDVYTGITLQSKRKLNVRQKLIHFRFSPLKHSELEFKNQVW